MVNAINRCGIFVAVLSLCCVIACKKQEDPFDQALNTLETDPKAAIPLFLKLHEADPKAFEPLYYLGVAYHESSEHARSVESLEKALALPGAKGREAGIRTQMYEAYLALSKKSKDESEKSAALDKAAELEIALSLRNPEANKKVFERKKQEFDAAVAAGEFDKATEIAEAVQTLYVPAEDRRALKKQVPELHKKKFDSHFTKTFAETFEKDWTAKGMFDAPAQALIVSADFTVPPKGEDGSWDETAEGFDAAVENAACAAVFRNVGVHVNLVAKASLYGKELDEKYLNYFGNEALKTTKKGWKTQHQPGAVRAADRGDGQPEEWVYSCQMHLPLATIQQDLYLLYKQPPKDSDSGANSGTPEEKKAETQKPGDGTGTTGGTAAPSEGTTPPSPVE
ncbi:MAG: hypothetical protein HUU55_15800 [Myxococcales bacterium]|nr:hypothetical protein [Myxococcales bacterium]